MKRWAAAIVIISAACAASAELPYANAPGTAQAPRFAPPPSPRGVPPETRNLGAGSVICNDPRLIGRRLSPFKGRLTGCGIQNPARVTAIAGVRLTAPIRVSCSAAIALADWTTEHAKPEASRMLGADLTAMRPVASYVCRTRNHIKGAKLSEHATGNAIDIAGFHLSDGRRITVLDGWGGVGKDYLQQIWLKACSDFGTVLGPNADKYHRDHFHLDTAKHRGGPYCR